MPSHTITTTVREERGLTNQLIAFNADRAGQNPAPAPWTADQLFQYLCTGLLDSLRSAGTEVAGRGIRAALDNAIESGDAAKVAAVKIALGI